MIDNDYVAIISAFFVYCAFFTNSLACSPAILPEFQAKALLNPSIVGYEESNKPEALFPTA